MKLSCKNMIAPDAFVEELIGAQEEAKQIRKILHELPDRIKKFSCGGYLGSYRSRQSVSFIIKPIIGLVLPTTEQEK